MCANSTQAEPPSPAGRLVPAVVLAVAGLPGWVSAVERFAAPGNLAIGNLAGAVSQISAVLGLAWLAATFVLMLPWPRRVSWFGGRERGGSLHHTVGVAAVMALLVHPLSLALAGLGGGAGQTYAWNLPGRGGAVVALGWVALVWLMAVLLFASAGRLPHRVWRAVHLSSIGAFAVAVVHVALAAPAPGPGVLLLIPWLLTAGAAIVWRLALDRAKAAPPPPARPSHPPATPRPALWRSPVVAAIGAFWIALAAIWALAWREDRPLPQGLIAFAELARHDGAESCWIAIDDGVYDVTAYVALHPTEPSVILDHCGQEASRAFETKTVGRPHSPQARQLLETYRIGTLGAD